MVETVVVKQPTVSSSNSVRQCFHCFPLFLSLFVCVFMSSGTRLELAGGYGERGQFNLLL